MPQGTVSPKSEEVVFHVEEIHFKHEIFCNMVIEGCGDTIVSGFNMMVTVVGWQLGELVPLCRHRVNKTRLWPLRHELGCGCDGKAVEDADADADADGQDGWWSHWHDGDLGLALKEGWGGYTWWLC